MASTADKPNIILMVYGDFGYGDAGACGGGVGRGMSTSSPGRLADEGIPDSQKSRMKARLDGLKSVNIGSGTK
jgi:hypothetical protein